jgi:hypothetical protein
MVKALIGFGIGLIGFGFYWKLYEDVITDFFLGYVRDFTDKYYLASDLIWKALPFFIVFLGVVCLIFGGKSAVDNQQEGD